LIDKLNKVRPFFEAREDEFVAYESDFQDLSLKSLDGLQRFGEMLSKDYQPVNTPEELEQFSKIIGITYPVGTSVGQALKEYLQPEFDQINKFNTKVTSSTAVKNPLLGVFDKLYWAIKGTTKGWTVGKDFID